MYNKILNIYKELSDQESFITEKINKNELDRSLYFSIRDELNKSLRHLNNIIELLK